MAGQRKLKCPRCPAKCSPNQLFFMDYKGKKTKVCWLCRQALIHGVKSWKMLLKPRGKNWATQFAKEHEAA